MTTYSPRPPFASQLDAEEAILREYLRRKELRKKGGSYLHFIRERAPWFVFEEWHVLLSEKIEQLRNGEIDRLMVFAPPRAGKSQNTSGFLPEFWIGNNPEDQILHISYATPLVEKFGRNIRNTIAYNETFQDMYPGCRLSKDSKASNRWNTTVGGEYNAGGVGTGIAGKGFHLGVIDDPISEQDAPSPTLRGNVNDWYGPGFYTRRMPERDAIILTMTRWATDDLAGFLLAQSVASLDADKWEVLKIPAIIDKETADELNRVAVDPRYKEFLDTGKVAYPVIYKEGDSFSPRRWPLKTLLRTKAGMSRRSWAALYQQSPVADGGNIIKREEWQKWPKNKPLPDIEYIIQCYDTAFEEGEENDYSARTTWGVFRHPEDGRYCVLLMSRMKERLTFPDLLDLALEDYRLEKPDRVLVEKRASGHSLIQEFRKRGVPVKAVPPKGKSKVVRAHAASVMFEQGCVFYPEGRKWAEEVVDGVCAFPNGPDDDVEDTVFYAINWLRRTYYLEAPDDEEDEPTFTEHARQPKRRYAKVHGNYARH